METSHGGTMAEHPICSELYRSGALAAEPRDVKGRVSGQSLPAQSSTGGGLQAAFGGQAGGEGGEPNERLPASAKGSELPGLPQPQLPAQTRWKTGTKLRTVM